MKQSFIKFIFAAAVLLVFITAFPMSAGPDEDGNKPGGIGDAGGTGGAGLGTAPLIQEMIGPGTGDNTVPPGNPPTGNFPVGNPQAGNPQTGDTAQSAVQEKLTYFVKSYGDIELYSRIDGQTSLVARFSKRPWGTWGIKGWYFVRKPYRSEEMLTGQKQLMAGENTDWEYVFRVVDINSGSWCFSGGNHENERLKNISFRDGSNLTPIELTPGGSGELEAFGVVETTYLDARQYGITGYAQAAREYKFSASKISAATEFTFLKDVYLGTSYVSMFPVLKDYGRSCRFEDTGQTFSSPAPGSTRTREGFENYLGKQGSLSALVWGDANPRYKFSAWIGNSGMTDGFRNNLKVFLWDLNEYGNKLYFSRFETKSPTLVRAGTVWHNTQGWDFLH